MFIETIQTLIQSSGSVALTRQGLIMIVLSLVLVYLATARKFRPLLLLPIAFGILLISLPIAGLMGAPANGQAGGLLYYSYQGVKLRICPSLIFLGIGTMTDSSPLIAQPSSLFLGTGARLDIVIAFIVVVALSFAPEETASIGITGGADGPMAIYLASKFMSDLLPSVTVVVYSYMALIPLIQPPIMHALVTKKEHEIKMTQPCRVSKLEKVCFPIMVTILCILLLPSVAPPIGMLMLSNLLKESDATGRLSSTAQNTLINIATIPLGVTVRVTVTVQQFLSPAILKIIFLRLVAFCFSTIGGLLLGKLMCFLSGGGINPPIDSASASAAPMTARMAQVEGQKTNPDNYLLIHVMGPNVAGVTGSVVAADILLSLFR